MKKLLATLLTFLTITLSTLSVGCSGNSSDSAKLKQQYEEYTYSHIIHQKYDVEWQKQLISLLTPCYDFYKVQCLTNDWAQFIATDYENVIVAGVFTLYYQEDSISYTSWFRIYTKNATNNYWMHNKYPWDLRRDGSVRLKYGTFPNNLLVRDDKFIYLGTQGDPSEVNFTIKEIFEIKLTPHLQWSPSNFSDGSSSYSLWVIF